LRTADVATIDSTQYCTWRMMANLLAKTTLCVRLGMASAIFTRRHQLYQNKIGRTQHIFWSSDGDRTTATGNMCRKFHEVFETRE